MPLPSTHRRALELLAAAPAGCTEALLQAHGISAEVIAVLRRSGWATANTRPMQVGRRTISVTTLWITPAGRVALER